LSRINYTAGNIQLAGNRNLQTDSIIQPLYSFFPLIPTGKGLIIEGDASAPDGNNPVLVSGGSLSSAGLTLGVDTRDEHPRMLIRGGGIVTTSERAVVYGSDEFSVPSEVEVSGFGSTWIVAENLAFNYLGNTVLGVRYATLNIRDGGLVQVGDEFSVESGAVVNLNGGTIRFADYDDFYGGTFNFNSGTIQLSGDRDIGDDEDITKLLGAAPTLTAGKGLTVEGTATLLASLTIDGGTFSTGGLASAEELQLVRGTFNLMNQAVTIGSGGVLGITLDVNEDMTVNVTLGITNQGLVTGDGQIGAQFTNAAAGELRAQAGRSLRLTGSGNTNAGQIKLLGGELEFTQNLTNSAGGFISGNGSLIVGGGLTNQGTMNFAGTANIDGAVTNAVGGKIISGGGGATIFYDDLVNNGEIRTSTNGFTVFFGAVSGSGTFTGTGTVNFEGDLSPGSSPAAVNFAGDVVLGPESTLRIELGGTAAGTQYDQINVAGELTLDGTLQISLINGFTPSAGQAFNILVWGSLAGAFSSIELPTLPGLMWDTSQLASGMLSVAPGLPGDFNQDGAVDTADFVAWSKGLVPSTPENYNTWRTNFGETVGPGSSSAFPPPPSALDSAVPEPISLVTLLLGLLLIPWRRNFAADASA
jgi:hypothetical protein